MQKVVSITSQGQLSIPRLMLQEMGVSVPVKAFIEKKGNTLLVKPKNDFWSLAGSLKSDIKLSDNDLKKAREEFSKKWAQND